MTEPSEDIVDLELREDGLFAVARRGELEAAIQVPSHLLDLSDTRVEAEFRKYVHELVKRLNALQKAQAESES